MIFVTVLRKYCGGVVNSNLMRKVSLLLISLISAISAFAAEPLTASKFFAEAPLEVLDMLRPSSRLDMLDYHSQADSLVSVPNALGGRSAFEEVADDYIRVAVTPVSTLEIKILPYKKGQIAMTLYTVGGDSIAADTEVRFFDAEMRQLPVEKFLTAPDPKTFFAISGTDITATDLREWMPFQTYTLASGPGSAPLTMTLTTLQSLPQETRARLRNVLASPRTAIWTGSRFKFQ